MADTKKKQIPGAILLVLVLGFAAAAAWLSTQAPHVTAETCRAPWESVLKEITQSAACTSAGQLRFAFAALCGLVGLSAATRLVIRFDK